MGQHPGFHRATLCVSAVFAVIRCLTVRLSVTLVDCIHAAEDIVKLLDRPGSPITLVFWPQRQYPIPFSGGAKYTRRDNFAIFDWKCCLSRKWCEISPGYYGTLIDSHKWQIDPYRFRWPWVTPNPFFKVKSNISTTVRLREKITTAH